MQTPHVQLIVDRDPVPPPLQAALNRLGARVSIRSFSKAAETGVLPSADVCVILPNHEGSQDMLDRVMANAAAQACATMVLPIINRSSPATPSDGNSYHAANGRGPAGLDAMRRLAPPQVDPDVTLTADEITCRIKALCEVRRPLRRMQEELRRLRDRETWRNSNHRDIDEQLKLASQVQNDLLPEPLLDADPLTVSTLYLPADFISGDIYDLARLDEDRFSFSIADATGHGLPAALLTFFIKNSFRGKEIYNGSYRIIEPDELLSRLNNDLAAAHLSQCQFITALHAVFDRTTGVIRWARGGAPYPILLRPGQPPQLIHSDGGLIGAFDQRFEVVSEHLHPGDILLFYTDGLEALLRGQNGCRTKDNLLNTEWLNLLAEQGPEPALQQLSILARGRRPADWAEDDISVIALKMN